MEDKSHLFLLIAIFLALGIGILIGASMGENAFVINQIAVIEKLKEEIICCQEQINNYFTQITLLEQELSSWESWSDDYLNPLLLQNQLVENNVKIIAQEKLPGEVMDFLRLGGCSYTAFTFASYGAWQEAFWEVVQDGLQAGPGVDRGVLTIDACHELLQGETFFEEKILESLEKKGLLQIEVEGSAFSHLAGTKPDLFIVAGEVDSFLGAVLRKIGEEGGTLVHVFSGEGQGQGAPFKGAGNSDTAYLIPDLHKFYHKFELLQIIQRHAQREA
jgi:hypothetical protein